LIAKRREEKRKERKRALWSAQNTTFSYDSHDYDCNVNSRLLITAAYSLATGAIAAGTQQALDDFSATLGAGWRDADGIPRLTSAAEIVGLGQALMTHIAITDSVSEGHKAAINDAQTLAELDLIDPTLGY
jgi:hypothetical protein